MVRIKLNLDLIRRSLVIGAACGVLVLLSPPIPAEAPDTSICKGLKGAAWGLCRGGVAADCASGAGTQACANLEATIRDITGPEPPWVVRSECPCDFSKIPINANAWTTPTRFDCKVDVGARIFEDPLVPSGDETILGADTDRCAMHVNREVFVHEEVTKLTKEQFSACYNDVIAYGSELIEAQIVRVIDNCLGK